VRARKSSTSLLGRLIALEIKFEALDKSRASQWAKYDDLVTQYTRLKYICIGASMVILAVIDVPQIIRSLLRS
jgi:hypothetical protein